MSTILPRVFVTFLDFVFKAFEITDGYRLTNASIADTVTDEHGEVIDGLFFVAEVFTRHGGPIDPASCGMIWAPIVTVNTDDHLIGELGPIGGISFDPYNGVGSKARNDLYRETFEGALAMFFMNSGFMNNEAEEALAAMGIEPPYNGY